MEESRYQKLADATFRKIEDLFRDVDTEVVDCERAGDVVTLVFSGGKKCVLNTQRPTQQIWLAANARAWHFSYDEAKDVWLSDKDDTQELFSELRQIVKTSAGLEL
jgi:CyaY protein